MTQIEQIEKALAEAPQPISIDDICKRVFGRVDERARNAVRVGLHRLDERGVLIKHAQTYALKMRIRQGKTS
jgi:hypothetical protein